MISTLLRYDLTEKTLHKKPFIIYVTTKGYFVGQQNANLVKRAYLLNMLTRVLSWSKIGKKMLT